MLNHWTTEPLKTEAFPENLVVSQPAALAPTPLCHWLTRIPMWTWKDMFVLWCGCPHLIPHGSIFNILITLYFGMVYFNLWYIWLKPTGSNQYPFHELTSEPNRNITWWMKTGCWQCTSQNWRVDLLAGSLARVVLRPCSELFTHKMSHNVRCFLGINVGNYSMGDFWIFLDAAVIPA